MFCFQCQETAKNIGCTVKGIRLGPTLPAFLSPTVVNVLVENFDIKPIGTVAEDIEAMLAGK